MRSNSWIFKVLIIPLSTIAESQMLEEAQRIVEAAQSKGLILRILGASAIRLHTPQFVDFHEKTDRRISDIDFASYKKFSKDLMSHVTGMGYAIDEHLYAIHGMKRHRYYGKVNNLMIDIFFDRLEMCHDIDFKGRLELDYPTITVADLLLEKLQIVDLGGKDMVDVTMLFAGHSVEEGNEKDCINGRYISTIMGKDWGFYYTVTTNLNRISESLPRLSHMADDTRGVVQSRIKDLQQMIEAEPKSSGWKLRARVGPRKKWYRRSRQLFRSARATS